MPVAIPGEVTQEEAPLLVASQQYVATQIVPLGSLPDTDTAATLVQALSFDTLSPSVNFMYQHSLVLTAITSEMTASAQDSADVNQVLRAGLIDYWNQQWVIGHSDDGSVEALKALHFFALGQAIVRASEPGDPAAASIVSQIWGRYAGDHPLRGSLASWEFLSEPASPLQVVQYFNQVLAVLGGDPVEVPANANGSFNALQGFDPFKALRETCWGRCLVDHIQTPNPPVHRLYSCIGRCFTDASVPMGPIKTS